MPLINATARFLQRREEARHLDGQFGEQSHSAPELTLVQEPEGQTLADILTEMDELGYFDDDDDLTAPPTDTYTGTPEEREALARQAELNDLLARAGIDRDSLTEKTLGDIQNGLFRQEADKKMAAEYQARMQGAAPAPEAEPRTQAERDVREAVDAIIVARGYTRAEYDQDGLAYMERWAREEQAAGRLQASSDEEFVRSSTERAEREWRDNSEQIADLGELTDVVWDEALEEDRLRALHTIRKLRPTKYIPLKDTNAAIRAELKQFPGAKFSVRGDSYSGGASTHISYVDGPPEDQVTSVAGAFAGATFDGMTDMKSYHAIGGFDEEGVPVSIHYGADFVFTRREYSEDVTRDAEAFIIQAFAAEGKTFDPAERNTAYEIPQAFYRRATEDNGGQRSGGSGYNFRSSFEHYGSELVNIASNMIANERWNERRK